MAALILRLRRRLGRDEGMTLAELLVAMMILSTTLAVFLSVLNSVQRGVAQQDYQGRNTDQARLAIEQLDREIRSGNVLYDPSVEANPGFVLRVYTQSNADTRTPAPGYVCALWEITPDNVLRTRRWPPLQPELATNWRVVAEGIVNEDEGAPAFALDPDSDKGGRVIDLTLLINNDPEHRPEQTIRVQSSVTGRNTSYGFPENVCEVLPS